LAAADIHGCFNELTALLKVAGYNPAYDQLILLGDYVDHGPDSYQVVKLVMELTDKGAVCLKGKHDQMFVAFMQEELDSASYFNNGGRATLASYKNVSPGEILCHLDFLDNLPVYWEIKDYFFVHAEPAHLGSPTAKKVIFGHCVTQSLAVYMDIYQDANKLGIDTGAGYGGYLSLVDLNGQISYSLRNPSGFFYGRQTYKTI